jgi:predicted S18 family serine protease
MLQRQQGLMYHSNKQLAQKSDEDVHLTSLCAELKDEVMAARGKVAPLEEEVQLLKESLQMMTGERDESLRQASEASSRADSLAKDLEGERSKA